MSTSARTRRRAAALVAAAALGLVAAGCSSSSDSTTSTTSGSTGTSAPGGTTGSTPGTTEGTTPGTVAVEIGNTEIRDALEADEPELWALVNFDYMTWNAFGGFNIPLVEGADTGQAVELCEAVIAVVDTGSGEGTEVIVATGVSASDLVGTPVAQRAEGETSCEAVTAAP